MATPQYSYKANLEDNLPLRLISLINALFALPIPVLKSLNIKPYAKF